jgi:hypothetical protein
MIAAVWLVAAPSQLLAQNVTRANANQRIINFSGRIWWVKANPAPVGPGPNHFSDSPGNVWVDPQGRLHLKITNQNGIWYCAEIVSAQVLGFGTNIWVLDSPVGALDPNVVFGLFTWSDDPSYSNREIDIEFSKFGNASDAGNAQYSVQPATSPRNFQRFQLPLGLTPSTHALNWRSGRISFQSVSGSSPAGPIVSQWNYAGPVPAPGNQNVRMNLWLFRGQPPTNHQQVEVIIRSYQYAAAAPRDSGHRSTR